VKVTGSGGRPGQFRAFGAGGRLTGAGIRASLPQATSHPGGLLAVTAAVDALASYVPGLLLQRLREQPESAGSSRADRMAGAVLLADVSGFTAIAERLAQQGPAGAEALGGLLNGTWGRLLTLIAEAGGDVLKFAGDALLACFPAGDADGGGLAAVTRRAAGCALSLQAALGRYAAAEEVRLLLRVGIGAGELLVLDVGGVYERRELLVAGAAVPQTAVAVQQALPGQVVVTPQAWPLVEGTCGGERLREGGVRLTSAPPATHAGPVRRPPLPESLHAALMPYLPRALLGPMQAGHEEWLAELRRVTVLFVNLPDLAHAVTLDRAERVMQAMQTALYRYEGSIDKLSVDDKGTMLVAALGLPPLAHEDDPARGVKAALAMRAALGALGERSAVGVATGRAFCGVVGNRWRREYTMLGAVVNLAARLMQAAPDGILCDASTARDAGGGLAFEALGEVPVKGWAAPVPVYRPGERTAARPGPAPQRAAAGGSLVGRRDESERLDEELRLLARSAAGPAAGRASVVVVEGEAGVGKSRLVGELLGRARASGLTVVAGGGDAVEHSTPYYAWREVFAELAPVAAARDLEARRLAVLGLLGPDQESRELAPLLDVVLSLELAETPSTAGLTAQGRADLTRDLLVRLLRAAVGGAPTVLVLEDAQWLDSASWSLALTVSRRIAPLLLVLVTRPQLEQPARETRSASAASSLLRAPGTTRLWLDALPPEDVEALICQSLGVDAVPAVVASLIRQKAEGNPLFVEELAFAVRDAGLVEVVDGDCRLAPGVDDVRGLVLPDTVQGVITSRLDRLPPAQQLTLKVASSIGRLFAFRILRDVHPVRGSESHLTDDLAGLERASLTMLDEPEPELTYLFKHVVIQETAYHLMLVSQRRQLHRAIAEWYERIHEGDLALLAPLLAYHWRAAEVPAKAIAHLEQAGTQALRTGAYQEAVRFFSEALELDASTRAVPSDADSQVAGGTGRAPDAATIRRARWEHQLGDAYHGLGQLGPEREHLHAALALLDRRVPASGRRLAAGLFWQVAQQARNRLWPRSLVARSPQARAALLEAAEVYERLNVLLFYANRRAETVHAAVKGLNLAEGSGSPAAVARLTASCGLSIGGVPLHRVAESYVRRGLVAAETAADSLTRAWVLQVSALHGVGIGRWQQASAQLEEAAAILDRLGDRRRLAEVGALLSLVAYFQGAFAEAAKLLTELSRSGRQTGDSQVQSWALAGQAAVALRSGDLERAALLVQDHQVPALAALLHLRRGEWQAAREAVQPALEWAGAAPIKSYWFDLYAMTAEAAVALWDRDRRQRSDGEAASRAAARRAVRCLRRYARAFPIGRPRSLLCQGTAVWVAARPAQALGAWRRSLAAAERLGMPYDQLLAHDMLARRGDPPGRGDHLTRARELRVKLQIGQEPNGTV
jgi:class 3 adenylate cyclase/tetratricopeptide (TPR) repeat protein